MATVEEHESSMTIIYSKSSGKVIAAFSGIQTIQILYGENGADYAIIWDELVVPIDSYILKNYSKFKFNLETMELQILPSEVPNYPIASQ